MKISTDQGKTWQDAGKASDGADLTDLVKGHQQYFIRFEAPAKDLARSGLTMRTVCQCNVAVIPRLRQGKNKVTYLASGRGVVSAGPNKDQGAAHVVDGALDSKTVTLELKTPRGEKAMRLYAASRVASGNPPDPNIKYFIEYSTDKGETWKPVVKDWRIERRKYEPGDFWSQSLNWGDVELAGVDGPVRVRFRNDGGKRYMIIEAHLVYEVEEHGPTEVTFAWRDAKAELKTESHTFSGAAGEEDNSWTVECRTGTETIWVEYSAK